MQSVGMLALLLLTTMCAAQHKAAAGYVERRDATRQRATAALDAEAAAEKAGACNTPMNTADTNQCLTKATAATEGNYRTYAAAVEALLRLQLPDATPPEWTDAVAIARAFRRAEVQWLRYRDAACDAVETMSCTQDLTRRHLQELSSLYLRLFE